MPSGLVRPPEPEGTKEPSEAPVARVKRSTLIELLLETRRSAAAASAPSSKSTKKTAPKARKRRAVGVPPLRVRVWRMARPGSEGRGVGEARQMAARIGVDPELSGLRI